jgi:hypothetical protein
MSVERIEVQHSGIGHVLSSRRLAVPSHQRPYAWTEEQVTDLFRDLADAINNRAGEYFLGTIVITRSDGGGPQLIIDGQQRVATTSILIGAMRDYLIDHQDTERADALQAEYLSKKDLRTLEETPHLRLADRDHDFYQSIILAKPGDSKRGTAPATPSQERLKEAGRLARGYVDNLASLTQQPANVLVDWIDYIRNDAKVIVVEVADEANAYIIFEVLNDRGLDLSVADLLKNYVFRLAGDRVSEARTAWVEMSTMVEAVGGDEAIKTFIRHVWSSRNGITRERELYNKIKAHVTSKQAAIDFTNELKQKSIFYNALSNPGHELWKPYGATVVQSIEVLELSGAIQIRPLLIAILSKFDNAEIRKSMPMMVAWTIRFLICGAGGSGTLENNYADRAKEISAGTLRNAAELWKSMQNIVPTDDSFREGFSRASVSKQYLARYYLRVLDAQHRGPADGEMIVNPSEEKVTLEHVMPQTREPHWKHIPEDVHKSHVKRIGNLALIDKTLNEKAGNVPFADKKDILEKTGITLTKKIVEETDWGPEQIQRRQQMLAELAIAAWNPRPRP